MRKLQLGARRGRHVANEGDRNNVSNEQKWQKPSSGTLKCNVDAAIFSQEGQYGIRMCIRNHIDTVIRSKTMFFSGVPHPQEAEAVGLKQAICWLGELGIISLTIELDFLPVVNGVNATNSFDNELGLILSSCKPLLFANPSYSVSYIRRQSNLVIHTFARASRHHANSQVFDFISNCTEPIVMNEMH